MSILTEANELIHGQRAKDYGHPTVNFQRIADLWNSYLRYSTTPEITPQDTAVMMILLKIARLQQNPENHDSLVDIAGYAGTIERLWTGIEHSSVHADEVDEYWDGSQWLTFDEWVKVYFRSPDAYVEFRMKDVDQ